MATFWGPVTFAQTTASDSLIVEMNQAFKRGDRKKLATLLPQARGHALEPYAAYWELRTRLDEASVRDVQDFFAGCVLASTKVQILSQLLVQKHKY